VILSADCPSEDTLLAYVQRLLPTALSATVEAHLGDCESCGRLVAEAARDLFGTGDATAAELPTPLAAGAKLGRHAILGVVGRGAMGVVYTAYDPELDRRVALKVLRPTHRSGDQKVLRERLLREGQAMARLSHPNVVTVYDVGIVDDEVFLAMEYVEGETLSAWLGRENRPWRAVLGAFLEAARGLAAAHGAGLVHRDFKPDNALVGKDGRVRVTDFGLARREGNLDAGSAPSLSPLPSLSLTQTGAVLGTPAYMSPEQLVGDEAGVPSDIFSFCAALWQALYRSHPFPTESFTTLREAVLNGTLREPAQASAVLSHVRRALMRGLRPKQEERFSSMDELVAALSADPVARLKRGLGIALPIAVALAALGGALFVSQKSRITCRASSTRLAAVWNDARKSSLRGAFAKLGVSYSGGVLTLVNRLFDEYGQRWVNGYTDACEATQVRGEQSPALLDRRMQCLDDRLRDLDALAGALERADRGVLDKAPAAAAALRSVEACADRETLSGSSPDPEDPQTRPRMEAARTLLSQARASEQTGRFKDGLDPARKVIDEARAMKAPLLEAEALFELGELYRGAGQANDAEASTTQALEGATRVGHKELQVRAETSLVGSLGFRQKTEEALLWSRVTLAEIEHMGNDSLLRANLLAARGWALVYANRAREATPFLEEAVALLTKRLGDNAPAVAKTMTRLGGAYFRSSSYQESARWREKALAISRETLGPEHPDTANAMYNLASTINALGRRHEALALMQQSIAIREKVLGLEHREVSLGLQNLASVQLNLGQCREMEASIERARAIYEKLYAPDHPEMVMIPAFHSMALTCLGRNDEAIAEAHRSVELAEKLMGAENVTVAYSTAMEAFALERAERYDEALAKVNRAIAMLSKAEPDHSDLAGFYDCKGRILRRRGRLDEALAMHRQALALTEKAFGEGHPDLDPSLIGIGRVLLDQGKPAEARANLERAVKIAEGGELDPLLLAEARLELGRALAAEGREPARGAELRDSARRAITASPYAASELRQRAR
jgi:tetratricopeptide (TPR) repeat protein/tRNA A-37 threonylcarbamoyl transferase component Bud32